MKRLQPAESEEPLSDIRLGPSEEGYSVLAEMPSIKVKDLSPNGGNDDRKAELWGYYATKGIKVWKVHNFREFFYLITEDEDIEKFLVEEIKDELKTLQFEIYNPPELDAIKTVILYQIDRQINSVPAADLPQIIENGNSWCKIEEVVRLGQAGLILKVRFTSRNLADRAITNGLYVMSQHVPPRMIAREAVVKLNPCTVCYQWSHFKNSCPTPTLIICNKCAREGHRSTTCRSQELKCINCRGDHPTLAYRCPIRKQLIKDKRSEEIKKNRNRQTSYAGALQHQDNMVNNNMQPPIGPQRSMNPDALSHIMSSMVFSQMGEFYKPGTFQDTLDQCYAANDLPKFKIPEGLVTTLGLGGCYPGTRLTASEMAETINIPVRKETAVGGAVGGMPPVALLNQTMEDELNSGYLLDMETEIENQKRKQPDSSGDSSQHAQEGGPLASSPSANSQHSPSQVPPTPVASTPKDKKVRATNPQIPTETDQVVTADTPAAETPQHPAPHRSSGARGLKLRNAGNPVCLRFLETDNPRIVYPRRQRALTWEALMKKAINLDLPLCHTSKRPTADILRDISAAISQVGETITAHTLKFQVMEDSEFDFKTKMFYEKIQQHKAKNNSDRDPRNSQC